MELEKVGFCSWRPSHRYLFSPSVHTPAYCSASRMPSGLPMIIGAAMGKPETIPGLIGLKVVAND